VKNSINRLTATHSISEKNNVIELKARLL